MIYAPLMFFGGFDPRINYSLTVYVSIAGQRPQHLVHRFRGPTSFGDVAEGVSKLPQVKRTLAVLFM